jgi:hypothetical protein
MPGQCRGRNNRAFPYGPNHQHAGSPETRRVIAAQDLGPSVYPLHDRVSTMIRAVPINETTSDPTQPSRLEKNPNITASAAQTCTRDLPR